MDKLLFYNFLALVICFIGGAYAGWSLADDIWWKGPLAFLGAAVGSAVWVIGMLFYARSEDPLE